MNLELTEEESTKLLEIDQKLLHLKAKLADLEISLSQISKEKTLIIDDFFKERNNFIEAMNYIANSHNIDLNGSEKYGLDMQQMVFKKL